MTDRRGTVDAHLDLGGEQRTVIVRAMTDQLGFAVVDVEPFGLEGSAGSSPLRMTLDRREAAVREDLLVEPRTG